MMVRHRTLERRTIPPHPMGAAAVLEAETQGPAPEIIPTIGLDHVEESSPDLGHPPIGDLDQRGQGHPAPIEQEGGPAGGVDRPAGDPQDRVLLVRPEGPKARHTLLLRPVGSLEPIVETVTATRPCTF